MIQISKLKGHVPESVFFEIENVIQKFSINNKKRLAHFLSQCAHESGDFKHVRENLNYSANALKETFGKYFPHNLADSYARQPEKIASRVYANRMGNGDEASKEGFTYRGRGYIQLTGKDNYKAFGKSVDADVTNNPDLVASQYPLLSAAWYWNSRDLNSVADGGASDDVVTAVTKKVNGGTIGLDDRIERFGFYYKILTPD
jgi:putative chitinase